MSATDKITTFVTAATESFTYTDVALATGVGISQVRPIMNALKEQGKIAPVGTKRTKMRGRPSVAFTQHVAVLA
jgi:predicted ArsR family transcriptional regulator